MSPSVRGCVDRARLPATPSSLEHLIGPEQALVLSRAADESLSSPWPRGRASELDRFIELAPEGVGGCPGWRPRVLIHVLNRPEVTARIGKRRDDCPTVRRRVPHTVVRQDAQLSACLLYTS